MTADVVDSAKERKELLLLLQYAEQKEREREKKGGDGSITAVRITTTWL